MDVNSFAASVYADDLRLGSEIVNRQKNTVNDIVNRMSAEVNNKQNFEEILLEKAATAQSGRITNIDKTDKLYEQCMELEIFMVKTLISSMRSTIQKSGLIDEGFAGKMYEDMLYDEYARDFAKNANFGMAELAYLELSGQR